MGCTLGAKHSGNDCRTNYFSYPSALPFYASLFLRRMLIAYILSFLFTLVYGYIAAYNRSAEHVLIHAILSIMDKTQEIPK